MGSTKCLRIAVIPVTLLAVVFYLASLVGNFWSTCDKWKYNNGIWKKCINSNCSRLYEANVQYRYKDNRCDGKENSYYISDNYCKNYYRCLNGVYDSYTCATGQFHIGTELCVQTRPSGCYDERCMGQVDGQYEWKNNECKSYYKCHNGEYAEWSCPANQYFNKLKNNTCNETLPAGCQDPRCIGQTNGWTILDSPNCTEYRDCQNGMISFGTCSIDQVVNVASKSCQPTAPPNSGCKDPRCNNQPDGYTRNSLCTTWSRCNNGFYTDGSCPATQYFSHATNTCVIARPNTCPDHRCHAYGMGNGQNVLNNICRTYFNCTNGAYTEGSCSAGPPILYFSTSSSTCQTTVPSGCQDPRCANKNDGYYNVDDTCRDWYRCQASMYSNGSCSVNQYIETSTGNCVSSPPSYCNDPRCIGQPDGKYHILDNQVCVGYYQCTANKSVDTYCPAGTPNFNNATGVCEIALPTGCVDLRCKLKVNGGYEVTNNECKQWTRCNNGTYTSGSCGAGQYFDRTASPPACQTAVPSACVDERCVGKSGYYVVNTNCASYYRCNNGVYTSGTCAANQQFDVSQAICLVNTPTGCIDPRCNNKADGYYVDDTVCQTYYRCMSGVYTSGTCAANQVFVISSDLSSGSCQAYTASGSTTCKDPRCNANPTSDGHISHPDCRRYYKCINGFRTDYDCGVYNYWNTATDVCTATLPAGCQDPRCHGKSNGGHLTVNNVCTNYYVCTNNVYQQSITCAAGTLFSATANACVNTVPAGCKVDGGYGKWTLWGACSVTIGIGIKTRKRLCNNPAPLYGGLNCTGTNTETHVCWICPETDWLATVRGLAVTATIASMFALIWAIVMGFTRKVYPMGMTTTLLLIAAIGGAAGLIVYKSNKKDFDGCPEKNGWSWIIGWFGFIFALIGALLSSMASCKTDSTVTSMDNVNKNTQGFNMASRQNKLVLEDEE